MNFLFSSPRGMLVAEFPIDTNRLDQITQTFLSCQSMGIASISSQVQVQIDGIIKDAEVVVRSQSGTVMMVMMLEISPGMVLPVISQIVSIESLLVDSTKSFNTSLFETFLQRLQPQTSLNQLKGA
ncbi:hypothetical protein AB6D11_00170 [Vibrio splendidus]